MEIKKIIFADIKGDIFYNYPETAEIGDKDFEVSFSKVKLDKNSKLVIPSDDIERQYMLLSGEIQCTYGYGTSQNFKLGQAGFIKSGSTCELCGKGHFIQMSMAQNARGVIRKMAVTNKTEVHMGETVGESIIALFGWNSGFSVETAEETILCDKNSALIIHMDRNEFCDVYFSPIDGKADIIYSGCILLGKNDFAREIGVRFLEQNDEICRARLDIRPEHLNPIGVVCGGAIFTLADAACGHFAGSFGGVSTTVNGSVQFLNAAFYPEYLIAEVRPRKVGKVIRNFEVEITDNNDVLISTAEFVFCNLQRK